MSTKSFIHLLPNFITLIDLKDKETKMGQSGQIGSSMFTIVKDLLAQQWNMVMRRREQIKWLKTELS